jgi:hypothetical protein
MLTSMEQQQINLTGFVVIATYTAPDGSMGFFRDGYFNDDTQMIGALERTKKAIDDADS